MSSIASSNNNTTATTAMPDDNTIYVASGCIHPIISRLPGRGPALWILAGGTDAARSKLDHPQGKSARTSIRDLQRWASACSKSFLWDFRDLTDDDLKSEVVKNTFDQWERDMTLQVSELLQSLMARPKPKEIVEMDDEETEEQPDDLEDVTEDEVMSVDPVPLQAEMADRDDWMRWMGPGVDYNHLLLYNFDKTDDEADDACLSARKGTSTCRGY